MMIKKMIYINSKMSVGIFLLIFSNWTLARIQPSNFEKQKIMRSFDRSSHSLGARNPEQPLPYSTVASQGNGRALATPPSFNRGRDSRNAEAPA